MISTIGPYTHVRLLGNGSTATVYLCDSPHGRCAVKWLNQAHAPWIRRFNLEVNILRTLKHRNIISVIGEGCVNQRPYVVLPYMDGMDGRHYAERLQRLPPQERHRKCQQIGWQLADALHYIHQQSLVHRDVKPSNLLFDSNDHCVLSDFGTVKNLTQAELTQHGTIIGTPNFASPEQLSGLPVDHRSDQFALGATLYYLLVNQHPFVDRETDHSPVPLSSIDPSIPANLEHTIRKMMQLRAEDRFPNMRAAQESLTHSPQSGIPLAGRQGILNQLSEIILRIQAGERMVIAFSGLQGVSRQWAIQTLISAAQRVQLEVLDICKSEDADQALRSMESYRPMLIIERQPFSQLSRLKRFIVDIPALSIADIRRTLFAMTADTNQLSQHADRLHFLTGGIPDLLINLLEHYCVPPSSLNLPETPQCQAVSQYFSNLHWESLEVLAAIALAEQPVGISYIETATQLPPEEHLEDLCLRGLISEVCEQKWIIYNQLFREEALRSVPDLDALRQRAQFPSAEISVDWFDVGQELAATGQLERAKSLAIQQCDSLESSSDRASYGRSKLLLGTILCDLGMFTEAAHQLADACALAKAQKEESLRIESHIQRARVSLEKNSNKAAFAIERLLPLLKHESPLLYPCWAWAQAALGDRQGWQQAREKCLERMPVLNQREQLRAWFFLLRGACAIGNHDWSREHLPRLILKAEPYPLLSWEMRRIDSLLNGSPPPATSPIAKGLSPTELYHLKRRWAKARGLSVDPTWVDV